MNLQKAFDSHTILSLEKRTSLYLVCKRVRIWHYTKMKRTPLISVICIYVRQIVYILKLTKHVDNTYTYVLDMYFRLQLNPLQKAKIFE